MPSLVRSLVLPSSLSLVEAFPRLLVCELLLCFVYLNGCHLLKFIEQGVLYFLELLLGEECIQLGKIFGNGGFGPAICGLEVINKCSCMFTVPTSK